jgi:hypothetical protein
MTSWCEVREMKPLLSCLSVLLDFLSFARGGAPCYGMDARPLSPSATPLGKLSSTSIRSSLLLSLLFGTKPASKPGGQAWCPPSKFCFVRLV